jgi:D-alanine-D-alanine ligase
LQVVDFLLELADLPYTGSGVAASAVGMDKVAMKAAFKAAGLPVVPHVMVETERLVSDPDEVLATIETDIAYPVFVKPSRLGSSVGIAKAVDRDGLREALDIARRYDRRLLVEPAMDGCIEVNCSVLGGGGRQPRASVCEQPVSWQGFLTFSEKYMRGGKTDKAPEGMAGQERRLPAPISEALTKQVQDNALAAFKAISAAGVARIDSFVDEASEKTWLMEINTVPGSFSFYLWEESGLAFSDLVEELLDIALATHRIRSELMFTFDSGILQDKGGPKVSPSGSAIEDRKMSDDRMTEDE